MSKNKKYYLYVIIALIILIIGIISIVFIFNNNVDEPKKETKLEDNIEVTDNKLGDGKLLILGAKNKNNVDVEVEFTINFLDKSDKIIESEIYTIYYLPSNTTRYVDIYIGDYINKDYKKYKISFKVKEINNFKHYDNDKIIVRDEIVDNKLNLVISNNTSQKIETLTLNIIFYKNNQMVRYINHDIFEFEKDTNLERSFTVNKDNFNNDIQYDRYEILYFPISLIDSIDNTSTNSN